MNKTIPTAAAVIALACIAAPAHATEGGATSTDTQDPTASPTAPSTPTDSLPTGPDASTGGPSSDASPDENNPTTDTTTSTAVPDRGTEYQDESTSSPGIGTAETTLAWYIPGYPLENTPTATDPAIWAVEQVTFDGTQYGWCQYDTGPAETLPADAFGPTLYKGEDYGWVTSWTFGVCGTPPVVEQPPTPVQPAPPVDTAPPAETGVETPAPVLAAQLTAAPELAMTGPVTGWLWIPAAGALLLGAPLFIAARIARRKANA